MAKSKRNVLFDKAKEVEDALNKNSETVEKILEKETPETVIPEASDIKQLPITKNAQENAQKLEQFEMLIEENRSLNSKIDELTDKIAEYVSEVEALREENKILNEKSKESNILKDNITTLTDEKEELQIKISELMMENAKILSEMSVMKEHNSNNTTQVAIKPNIQPARQPMNYRPYTKPTNANGYSSWN